MASLIHEIENNEALLLMYLSGELSPEDQVEVEQMLAADAGLRTELGKVESAYEFAIASLEQLDADRAAVAGENHAIRQAKRAMKQWQIDRLNRQPSAPPAQKRRVPAWAYPSAVAAMLLIGTLTYWGIVGDSAGTLAQKSPDNSAPLAVTPPPPAEIETITKVDLSDPTLNRGELSDNIKRAERQASTLMARSDSNSVASNIFLDDSAE